MITFLRVILRYISQVERVVPNALFGLSPSKGFGSVSEQTQAMMHSALGTTRSTWSNEGLGLCAMRGQ